MKRIINISVLPGEPSDGTGRVCVHLFVRDEKGPFTESHVLHPALDDNGQQIGNQMVTRPTKGRLACDPKRLVAPVTRKGTTTITMRTDDPRATTCLKCIASKDYMEMMAKLTQAELANK